MKIEQYSFHKPLKLLYVSIINFYKHQWNVVEATANLRKKHFPLELHLVGPAYKPALKKLEKAISKHDTKQEFIKYVGAVNYKQINECYKNSDIFIFASSCENMPNILLEAMSSGLPILCSSYEPMPEFLKDAGIYFDPTNTKDLTEKLEMMVNDHVLRQDLAFKAYNESLCYTWEKSSFETFKYFKEVAEGYESINFN